MLTAANTSKEIPVITTPRAVPAAGGCSISITTIVNMAAPQQMNIQLWNILKSVVELRKTKIHREDQPMILLLLHVVDSRNKEQLKQTK